MTCDWRATTSRAVSSNSRDRPPATQSRHLDFAEIRKSNHPEFHFLFNGQVVYGPSDLILENQIHKLCFFKNLSRCDELRLKVSGLGLQLSQCHRSVMAPVARSFTPLLFMVSRTKCSRFVNAKGIPHEG